jgi:hypothetical protein
MGAGAVTTFDPYSAWLGLPPGSRPPDPYTLLGVARFERDPARIAAAAAERLRLINRKAPFDRGDEMREVLDEIASAQRVLADPVRRRRLELELRASEKRQPDAPSQRAVAVPSVVRRAAKKPLRTDERAAGRRVPWPVVLGSAAAVGVLMAVGWLVWPSREPGHSREGAAVATPPMSNRTSRIANDVVPNPPLVVRPPVQATKPEASKAAATEVVSIVVRSSAPAAVFAAPTAVPIEARKPTVSTFAEYRPPRFASEADREAYARHVRDLLYEAFMLKGEPSVLMSHFRQADSLAPDDPFTEYAAAIAFWKRLRFQEAEAHLRAARGPDEEPFHPARRASIRMHLSRNRRSEALKESVTFARALHGGEGDDSREANEASIRWLGRLTAALESPWLPNTAQEVRI